MFEKQIRVEDVIDTVKPVSAEAKQSNVFITVRVCGCIILAVGMIVYVCAKMVFHFGNHFAAPAESTKRCVSRLSGRVACPVWHHLVHKIAKTFQADREGNGLRSFLHPGGRGCSDPSIEGKIFKDGRCYCGCGAILDIPTTR